MRLDAASIIPCNDDSCHAEKTGKKEREKLEIAREEKESDTEREKERDSDRERERKTSEFA